MHQNNDWLGQMNDVGDGFLLRLAVAVAIAVPSQNEKWILPRCLDLPKDTSMAEKRCVMDIVYLSKKSAFQRENLAISKE